MKNEPSSALRRHQSCQCRQESDHRDNQRMESEDLFGRQIEEFGKIGKNLLTARKIPAPCWVVVTSLSLSSALVALH